MDSGLSTFSQIIDMFSLYDLTWDFYFWVDNGVINTTFYKQPVLATFVLGQEDLQRLKKWVAAKCPTLSHVSSFTVACAYVWACMAKARAKSGEDVGENEPEHLAFVGDCWAYFDPPIPANYFGNCLAPCSATLKSLELITENGFIVAANTMGKAIQERLRNKEGILKGLEKWMSNYKSLNPKRIFGVAGSPKFSCYGIDFGLGRPCKGEIISIDVTKSISLNEGKNNKEDVEIDLSFPKIKMDVLPLSLLMVSRFTISKIVIRK